MGKRWRQRRDGSDGCGPAEPEAPPEDHAGTSGFERPPTAEELRAAFGRKRPPEEEPPPPEPDFASTFTTESLFSATVDDLSGPGPEPEIDDRSRTTGDYYYDPDDAWAALGLEPGASWDQIAGAHRRLAKLHHPDRLVDATEEQRSASEARMRDVNVAYSVLRRLTGN